MPKESTSASDLNFVFVIATGIILWLLSTVGCATDKEAVPKPMPVTQFQQSISDYTKQARGFITLYTSGMDKMTFERHTQKLEDLRMEVLIALDDSQLGNEDRSSIEGQMIEISKSIKILGVFRSTTGADEALTERLDEFKLSIATIKKLSEGRTRLASNSSKDTQ